MDNVKFGTADLPKDVKWLIQFVHYEDRIDVGVFGMVHYEFEEHEGRKDGKIHVQFPDGCGYTITRNANPFARH